MTNTAALCVTAVAIVLLGCATGLAATGDDEARQRVLGTMMMVIGVLVPAVATMLKADKTSSKVDAVEAKVSNGIQTAAVVNAVKLAKHGETTMDGRHNLTPAERADLERTYEAIRSALGKAPYEV